jgi:hypothetical protein
MTDYEIEMLKLVAQATKSMTTMAQRLDEIEIKLNDIFEFSESERALFGIESALGSIRATLDDMLYERMYPGSGANAYYRNRRIMEGHTGEVLDSPERPHLRKPYERTIAKKPD